MAELIALSSESDSDDELDTLMLLYLTSKWQKSVWKSEYMKKRKTHKYLVAIWTSCSPNDWYHIKPSGVGRLRKSVLPFPTLLSNRRSAKTVSETLRGAGEIRRRTVLPCPTSQLELTYSKA
jgi:hypothetical protein